MASLANKTSPISPTDTSSVSISSPINILQLTNIHIGLGPHQQSVLFSNTFIARLKALEDIQASTPNARAARRISSFLEVAKEAIEAISKLKLLIIKANDSKNTTGRKEEGAIEMANLCALTALNNMYTILGRGGSWHESEPGRASQNLAGGVARYLDFVKAQHVPKDFPDEDEGDEDTEDKEQGDETAAPANLPEPGDLKT